VSFCPFLGILSAFLIGNLPHFSHILRIEMSGNRKFIAYHSSPSFASLKQVIKRSFLVSEYREGWAYVSTEKLRNI
jgi:hypothetical protein